MKYIRTKDGMTVNIHGWKETDCYFEGETNILAKSRIFKQADTIEDLIIDGDLVKYYDQTTKQYDFSVITKLWQPHQTAIYRVVELYIKQENGDWHLVAKDKGNYKLELV